MVQVVENWSNVLGRVEAVEFPEGSGQLRLRLRVDAVDAVAGYPNLLADVTGETIWLRGPAPEHVPTVGEQLRCRVRKAGPSQYFFLPASLASS